MIGRGEPKVNWKDRNVMRMHTDIGLILFLIDVLSMICVKFYCFRLNFAQKFICSNACGILVQSIEIWVG